MVEFCHRVSDEIQDDKGDDAACWCEITDLVDEETHQIHPDEYVHDKPLLGALTVNVFFYHR